MVAAACFIVSFFNSGILLILMSAKSNFPILDQFFQGAYADFSPDWYNDIGYIIFTNSLINSLYPLMDVLIYMPLWQFKKMRDQGKWYPKGMKEFPQQTSCTSVSQYYNLYAGPVYNIHNKLASIQSIVCITLLFGAGMPILFVIAAMAFAIMYMVERYTIAKYYRQPANYGPEISLQTIKELRIYCIILLYPMGFWIFSNRQIFENEVSHVNHESEVMSHSHTIIGSLKRISPGSPFLTFFPFLAFWLIKRLSKYECLGKYLGLKYLHKRINSMHLWKEENNFYTCKAPFFSVIKEKEKKQLMRMEELLKFGLNIENVFTDHDTLHKMMDLNDHGQDQQYFQEKETELDK